MCIVFAGSFSANSQTYSIPDINLRNKLLSTYPSLMHTSGQLIIDSAKALSKDLNLDDANISNADGLQFFERTGIVRLRNNNLSAVPQLSSMKNLRRIYLDNNNITALPQLSALYQLIGISITKNKLTSISIIQHIKTLQYFYCSNNNIDALPDLSLLTNLKTISIAFNPISALPNLSFNTNLQQLDIKNTNINTIASLASISSLEVLNCENNNITDLSGLNSNTKLITLTAQNNLLTTLPNFSNKPALSSVNISTNHLTFEDIIPLTALNTFSKFTYAPQKDLKLPLYVEIRESNNYMYDLLIDPLVTSNQYAWKKNNTVTNTSGSLLSFTPVLRSDSGTYSVTVRNPLVPGLELKSNASKLKTNTCIEVNELLTATLSSDCREGSNIDFSSTIVEGALAPVTYRLINTHTSKEIPGTLTTQFNKVTPGAYTLIITDFKNCSIEKPFYFDDQIDCQKVITPNNDGILDDYFIAETGSAQIYNTSRKLVKTIDTPGVWDGSTDNGSLADSGYYVIVINGSSSYGISLMR